MFYLISVLLLVSVLVSKVFFIMFAKGSSGSLLELASVLILGALVIFGSINYFRSSQREANKNGKPKFDSQSWLFMLATILFVLLSFYININKHILTWDAVALYDARAQFMLKGITFKDMIGLSKFDPQNSYYYLLYPPFTSLVHFLWYKIGVPLHVSVYYSLLLLVGSFLTYHFTSRKLGTKTGLLMSLLFASGTTVFTSSVLEYTNLPFTIQLIMGIFLLNEFLEDGQEWKLYFGAAAIVTSQWIRFLEPMWLGIISSFIIFTLIKKFPFKRILIGVSILVHGILEYISWQSYVSSFGESTKIVGFHPINFIEPAVGVFTGSFVSILLFFVKSWGPILLVHLFAVVGLVLINKKVNFLQIVLTLCVLIYLLGLYYVSFQSEWWKVLGDSLVRGSAFMIPVSGYLILKYLNERKT